MPSLLIAPAFSCRRGRAQTSTLFVDDCYVRLLPPTRALNGPSPIIYSIAIFGSNLCTTFISSPFALGQYGVVHNGRSPPGLSSCGDCQPVRTKERTRTGSSARQRDKKAPLNPARQARYECREGEKGREREKRREEVMHAGATHKKCPHGNSRMSVIQVYLYIYLCIHMHNLPLRI